MDIEDMVDTMGMPDHMDTMEDTGERRRGLLMPSPLLMLMPMPMPTLGMDTTDIVHMDTGERRRGLLTPPLMPMPLLTLTILDTMVLVLDTVRPQLAGVDTEVDTTGDKIFLL